MSNLQYSIKFVFYHCLFLYCFQWVASPALAAQTLINLEDCFISNAISYQRAAARCGFFQMEENKESTDAGQIELFVAVIPAQTQKPAFDPLVFLTGGPGQAATETYVLLKWAFQHIQEKRDIILIDQRGTGRSSPLQCAAISEIQAGESSSDELHRSIRRCLTELPANPKHFTTSIVVQDLDKVRQMLGYDTWNLYGISYGTRVALHYLRQYPDKVRAVILDGVVPADFVLGPMIALEAEQTLESIFKRCTASENCRALLDKPMIHFKTLLQQLEKKPVSLRIDNPNTGKPETVTLDRSDVAGVIRMLSYSPEGASIIPVLLSEAYTEHNYAPLAKLKRIQTDAFFESFSLGMHYAVLCTEDIPFYKSDNNKWRLLEKTYLSNKLLDGFLDICKSWPAGSIDKNFKEPVHSNKPVLLLSGSDDPITPPGYAEHAKKTLSNSKHIIGQGQGHGLAPIGCIPKLMARFIEQAHFENLDDRCLESQKPAPFFIDFYGPEP